MKQLFTYFSWFVVTVLFVSIAVFFYWSVKPYRVIEFREGNGTVLEKKVKAGGTLEIRQTQCKFMNLTASVDRQFINSLIYQANTIITKRPVGCFDTTELVAVPALLPSGIYKIRTDITYRVNPIRTINYQVITNEFEIVNDTIKKELPTTQ